MSVVSMSPFERLMPILFLRLLKERIVVVYMVSNAALRSHNNKREIQPRLDDKSKSFVTFDRQY